MDKADRVSRKCVYAKLESDLRRDIMAGKFKPRLPLPGEIDFAGRYKISRQSARKAIQILEKEGLLRRVRGKGTFVVPPEERGIGIERNSLHILCGVAWFEDGVGEYNERFLEGATEYAFRAGHKLSCFSSTSYDRRKLLDRYRRNEFDVIIWLSMGDMKDMEKDLKDFHDLGIPQLLINRTFGELPSLMCDSRKALAKTTSFLLETGHRKIGFVNRRSDYFIYQERKAAFFDTMFAAGIDPEPLYLELDLGSLDGLTVEYVKSLSALIVGGKAFLQPFLHWAQSNDIHIPDDLSIISVNDSFAARTNPVPVSVFSESRFELGKQSIHLIEAIIRGQVKPGECVMINGDLIIRDSCKVIR